MGIHRSALFHSTVLFFYCNILCYFYVLLCSVPLYYTLISAPLYSTLLHYCASTQTSANRRRRGSSHCQFSLCCWSWCLCCYTLQFRSWILVLSCLMTVTCRLVHTWIPKCFCQPNPCLYVHHKPPAVCIFNADFTANMHHLTVFQFTLGIAEETQDMIPQTTKSIRLRRCGHCLVQVCCHLLKMDRMHKYDQSFIFNAATKMNSTVNFRFHFSLQKNLYLCKGKTA